MLSTLLRIATISISVPLVLAGCSASPASPPDSSQTSQSAVDNEPVLETGDLSTLHQNLVDAHIRGDGGLTGELVREAISMGVRYDGPVYFTSTFGHEPTDGTGAWGSYASLVEEGTAPDSAKYYMGWIREGYDVLPREGWELEMIDGQATLRWSGQYDREYFPLGGTASGPSGDYEVFGSAMKLLGAQSYPFDCENGDQAGWFELEEAVTQSDGSSSCRYSLTNEGVAELTSMGGRLCNLVEQTVSARLLDDNNNAHSARVSFDKNSCEPGFDPLDGLGTADDSEDPARDAEDRAFPKAVFFFDVLFDGPASLELRGAENAEWVEIPLSGYIGSELGGQLSSRVCFQLNEAEWTDSPLCGRR